MALVLITLVDAGMIIAELVIRPCLVGWFRIKMGG